MEIEIRPKQSLLRFLQALVYFVALTCALKYMSLSKLNLFHADSLLTRIAFAVYCFHISLTSTPI